MEHAYEIWQANVMHESCEKCKQYSISANVSLHAVCPEYLEEHMNKVVVSTFAKICQKTGIPKRVL